MANIWQLLIYNLRIDLMVDFYIEGPRAIELNGEGRYENENEKGFLRGQTV